jgi:hypothetical protein
MSNEILNWNDFLNEAKKKKKKKSSKKVSSKKSKTKVINNNYYSSNLGYGYVGIRPAYSLPYSSPNIINNNINNNITVGGNDGVDCGTAPTPTSESVELKFIKKFPLE